MVLGVTFEKYCESEAISLYTIGAMFNVIRHCTNGANTIPSDSQDTQTLPQMT